MALLLWLHPGTVKTLDKRTAQAARSMDGIITLGINEIALGRGQTYWHLGSAPDASWERGCFSWARGGRSRT